MESLIAHCSAAFSQNEGLFAAFFIGGLTGGFTHCITMCGPIVAGQAACNGCAKGCKKTQISNATQFQYHLGRLTTYGILGFLAALFSRQLASFAFWPWVSTFMLALAGGMFIASSLPSCHHRFFKFSIRSTYFNGVMLGFMPCGLIYAALMMAATLADPFSGAFAMVLFTLGTMPALVIASIGTSVLSQKWQNSVQILGRAMMAFNGASLLVMASRIVR